MGVPELIETVMTEPLPEASNTNSYVLSPVGKLVVGVNCVGRPGHSTVILVQLKPRIRANIPDPDHEVGPAVSMVPSWLAFASKDIVIFVYPERLPGHEREDKAMVVKATLVPAVLE